MPQNSQIHHQDIKNTIYRKTFFSIHRWVSALMRNYFLIAAI